ncbi:SGNH/GDSL hydrolase family protein [Pseudonocardia nigra]|uniref:SGNH/GDSL hydrolase family protein n=1 Tax=Pseudonocardia nigra TaxID=1921578 RepID=UPI001C5F2A72|nr:SGNH/GDSL hydrolase family protein [Pseudonocardia nigra]
MNLTSARLVAVGDSVSEGVGDPRGGRLHGWVPYLAADAGFVLVANLARTGATVAAVRRDQLEAAVALAPDVVTCVVGVNDVLCGRFDAAAFEVHYDHVVGTLSAAASRGVLTMTLHDITAGLPLPRPARAAVRSRTGRANAVIERVARRHGAWVLDGTAAPALRAAGMLSIDRLHPNARGHRFIAASALDVLRAHGLVPAGPAAVAPPVDSLPARLAAGARHALWLGRRAVALPGRRARH